MKELYLFRHGQTDYNVKRAFYGSSDVPLNETGIQQARTIQIALSSIKIDTVYTSDLLRAKQTAKIVFPNFFSHPLPQLNEKGFGLWEGLDANAIQEAFPIEWQAWLNDPFAYTPPQAEQFKLFEQRVLSGLNTILKQTQQDKRIAIVAHLGVLRIIYQQLIDKQADFWSIDFPQGEVRIFSWYEEQWHIKKE
ncbi:MULTISPECIES: histidine phosphatase family protein [unclassified Granulicatella]|uniref:histidine phosphatase family protein n=1 Tax=unclassified Granulicatella TaxID=2630493 RepID=UPI001074816E|nr:MULTISPECIES: histidine phosphatase family protein [unclassified Granulicatella]MBF0779537.1 histidine phosphatase family protein [Granulicatella sp. 19428wC4_WM01]TFU96502.1 histidine phosphatase family protein [Granulicatella sp. WM01]